MYPSWFKLETKTSSEQSKILPFDLMYLLPKKDLGLFSRVYDVFIEITPSEGVLSYIRRILIAKLNEVGVTRKFTNTTAILTGELAVKYLPEDLSDAVLCIPSLPRKKAGKVGISYMVSKDAVRDLTKAHAAAFKTTSVKDKLLNDMILHHNGQESLPCVMCANSMNKITDPRACSLGTTTCLEKICLRNVEAFDDKLTKSPGVSA